MPESEQRYYLETSAHLERWAGERAVRESIKADLGSSTHATSTHVLREWKRIVEGGAATVLNVSYESKRDLSTILARLRSGFGRTPSQNLLVLHLITSGGPIDATVELRARRFLRYEADKLFHRQIDTVRDDSECGLARNVAFQDKSGRWALVDRCKKTDKICRQDQYLEDRLSPARQAAEALVTLSPRPADKKMGKTMLQMLAKPADRKGKNCYWRTGDISIALECGPTEVLITTDQSFLVIGPAIGINVKRISSTRAVTSASAGT